MITSCKKQELPELPEGNDPIYKMSGNVNGEIVDLSVGENSVVMRHGISSMNGVKAYYGEMESLTSDDNLRIEFVRPEKEFTGMNYTLFEEGELPFLFHKKGKVKFDFGGVGNELNNLRIADDNGNFANVTTHEIQQYGYKTLRLKFDQYQDSNEEFNIILKHGFDDELMNPDFHVQTQLDTVIIQPIVSDYHHEWYIDGVLVGREVIYTNVLEDGIHQIIHIVRDDSGNEAFKTVLIRQKWSKEFWQMDVNYTEEYEFSPYNYGQMVVSMEKAGEWYRSDLSIENEMASFDVSDVTFIPNASGDLPLVSFQFNFDAVLVNAAHTDSLILTDMTGRFLLGLEN
ncbi:MAG: hypothetical protein ACPG21_09435 [Crocinitomicaceae bacterium]